MTAAGETFDVSSLVTITQVIARAREIIDPGVWIWTTAGAGEGRTGRRNKAAFDQYALRPSIMHDVSSVDTSTSFLGVDLDFPVMAAPVGGTILYTPGGGVASASGAVAAGVSGFCGSLTQAPWEEIAAVAPGRYFLQIYVMGDHVWLGEIADRAEAAGFAGICVTVDSVVPARRDGVAENGFDWRRERELVPSNLISHGRDDTYKSRFIWPDLEWLCKRTNLPVILKGVMRGEDAATAIDHGVSSLYVSNHGGRSLDRGLGTIEVLEEVVAAGAGRVDIVVDGGFTRGSEVCLALAMGAQAVAIGQLQLFGLAIGGAEGLAHVLGILKSEVAVTMAMLGCSRIDEIGPDHVRDVSPLTVE